MSTTYIAMIVSILLGLGLLVGIGFLSLFSGALNFLFVKPRIEILKSENSKSGFAFICKWDQDAEPVKFDRVRIHLFNPFGSPKELDVMREFDGATTDFVRDIDLGETFAKIISLNQLDKAVVEIEIIAGRDNVTHKHSMKGPQFLDAVKNATRTMSDVESLFVVAKEKPRFEIPERTFISPPLPKTAKQLKLASNPIFAGEFAGGTGGTSEGAAQVANYSVTKVWIEPGCIVCDACEAIAPLVFEVTDSTCVIRPGAPLDDGLKIQEAAEACPVEVIKFTKAG